MNRVEIEILAGGDHVNSDGSQGEEQSKNWWGQGLESAPQWIEMDAAPSSLGVAVVAAATPASCPSIVLAHVHVHQVSLQSLSMRA